MADHPLTPHPVRNARRLYDLARTFMNTIKGKIFMVFAVTFLSVCVLMVINLVSLATVKERLLLSERYDDLLNNILEVRRFEKNYLFSHDASALEEGIAYLHLADDLVEGLAEDIERISDRDTLTAFQTTLVDYERSLTAFRDGGGPDDENSIRRQGKALLDFADSLRRIKRGRIHATIVRTQWLPLAFLAVFLLLMILVIHLISKGLLRPLDLVRKTTGRVARGDFRPIPVGPDRHIGEISGLITAFNRMSEELETNQEDLLQARKIAALGTFTAGIAHELNNPINNISLTAEAMLEGRPEVLEDTEDEDGEMLREIMAQADRAGDIVRNLLDFSRTESPSFTTLRPERIVNSTMSLIRNQIMLGNLRVDVEVSWDAPAVTGDLRGLQQVFMNLLLNAIQATPGGGLISVAVSGDPEGWVRFEIRDTGSGIAPEALEHIFEPFYTTKEVGKGTGLGLSVTYAIVKRHGGRIEVESESGKGTVFTVRLPKARAESEGGREE